jgi:hypothetical protein
MFKKNKNLKMHAPVLRDASASVRRPSRARDGRSARAFHSSARQFVEKRLAQDFDR